MKTKVKLRKGWKARIICDDRINPHFKLIVLFFDPESGTEACNSYSEYGKNILSIDGDTDMDLIKIDEEN